MPKNIVTVLQDGYSNPCNDGKSFTADCTVTLIKSQEAGNILVDTSGPWNKNKLVELLTNQEITTDDISTVVCSHGHSDHVGNLNLFSSECKIIVSHDISIGNVYEDFNFEKQKSYKLSSDIEIIPTPGHTYGCVSVVVRNTQFGTIVVAGDLFENENDRIDEDLWKSNSENPDLQLESRTEVLKFADFIVPGHGSMFAVKS